MVTRYGCVPLMPRYVFANLKYFEFCSGNLNVEYYVPKNRLLKSLLILCRLVFIVLPFRNWMVCFVKLVRSFSSYSLDSCIKTVAFTVGQTDLYYESIFSEDRTTTLVHIIPNKLIASTQTNLDNVLTPNEVIIEAFLFHFRFFQSIRLAKQTLQGSKREFDPLDFWYQFFREAESGQLASLILLERAINQLLNLNPQVDLVVVPWEGRAWEKLITNACRNKAISVGFCHSAITGAHQGILGEGACDLYPPNYLLCPGQYFKQVLEKAKWQSNHIFVVPYLRHRSTLMMKGDYRELVVTLTGNSNIANRVIRWVSRLTSDRVRVSVSLNKRANSYDLLSSMLRRYEVSEWNGVFTNQTVVLTRSISALIELRAIKVPTVFLFLGDEVDRLIVEALDFELKQGMVDLTSEDICSTDHIFDGILAIDWTSFNSNLYFKKSNNAREKIHKTINGIRRNCC